MNRALIALLATVCATGVFAQTSQASPKGTMSTSNAQGVQIQGNTDIKATQENAEAKAKGEGSTARNTSGAIKGGTQIQGNTTIKSAQKNASADAGGKNSKAANETGTIGGK